VPCSSPCWLSAAARDMIPCKAGPATEPMAVSGVSAKAIQPLVIKPSATKASHTGGPPELQLAKIGPDAGVDEESDGIDKGDQHQPFETRQLAYVFERAKRVRAPPLKRAADFVCHGFGEHKVAKHRIRRRKHGCRPERRARAIFGKHPANQRAEDEANAKGRADEAKICGFLIRF